MHPQPSFDLAAIRRRIPILQTHVVMNGCSQAPQSDVAREAAEAYLESWQRDGMDWERWIAEVEAARGEFAALLGADAGDVAVATSVSQATASLATGLDYTGTRHRVLVSGMEFPTVSHVWLAQERFGAEVSWVPVEEGRISLERYEEAIGGETLLVSAARAWYQNGAKQDIAALADLAHDRGALLFVDVYQALGTEPFDAPGSGADVVASGNLKFLMGIPGIAFIWVRPDLAQRLRPAVTGWFGRKNPFAFDPTCLDWADGARRLDVGTPPILEAYVARAGMAWLREIGLEAIHAWTRVLGSRLLEGAEARGIPLLDRFPTGDKAPTTAFQCDDSHAVESALRDRGVIASARGPAIRLAPHFFNTLEDVDQALDELAAVTGRA